MINVTKTFLPDFAEYSKYLEEIWRAGWVTNHGPMVTSLEAKLSEYLGAKHVFFVGNGTLALQIAIRALCVTGEIITTPFSYAATTSSIVWEGCKPIFVDIDPNSLTLDPDAVERAITPQTQAILAVHVYGHPCDLRGLARVAEKHSLRLIYDAAHAFGVTVDGRSISSFGDVSTFSFHATKIFHTVEGGAIVTDNNQVAHRVSYLRNFGHQGPEQFWDIGINAKNSELHAAMGHCVLPKLPQIIERRRQIAEHYDRLLSANPTIIRPKPGPGVGYNYAYYPVVFASETDLRKAYRLLMSRDVTPRRYFFPALNTLPYVKYVPMPNAEDLSSRVICLPYYYGLEDRQVEMIAETVLEAL